MNNNEERYKRENAYMDRLNGESTVFSKHRNTQQFIEEKRKAEKQRMIELQASIKAKQKEIDSTKRRKWFPFS